MGGRTVDHQQVLRLDIAVDNAVGVEVAEGAEQLVPDDTDRLLGVPACGQVVGQLAARAPLLHDPQRPRRPEGLDHVEDVRVPERRQQAGAFDGGQLLAGRQHHLLHRVRRAWAPRPPRTLLIR